MSIVFVAVIILLAYVVVSLFAGKRIFLPLLGGVTTILVGYLADALIGLAMNWPGAGAVFAIAAMGGFLLWAVQEPKPPKSKDETAEHGEGLE